MKMLATASKWLLALLLVNRATAEVYENGLEIDTTKPGDCAHKSKSGDTVEVHYKGMLMDGTVFDESYKRGAPFELQLGRGMVIAGWEYGLLDMCLGEERLLIIPPQVRFCCCSVLRVKTLTEMTAGIWRAKSGTYTGRSHPQYVPPRPERRNES